MYGKFESNLPEELQVISACLLITSSLNLMGKGGIR
jgi:hypothetical protein